MKPFENKIISLDCTDTIDLSIRKEEMTMNDELHKKKLKCELYNDNFQSWKQYPIHKAQLVIADIPYNIGCNFYGSNPMWYNGGDNSNGESKLAGKAAFTTDFNFNIAEYFHFCNQLLKKEPKRGGGERQVLRCSLYDRISLF